MASAGWELQKSIFAKLTTNVGLLTELGGPRVYDDAPAGAAFPYVTFAQTSTRDFDTASEASDEHVVTLHVWSRAGGRRETHEIIGRVRGALHDAFLVISGHRLVNLRHEFSETRRDPDGEHFHGIVRFRAVTEPVD